MRQQSNYFGFLIIFSREDFHQAQTSDFQISKNFSCGRLGLNDNYLTSSTLELSFLSLLSNCKYLEFFSFYNNPLDGIVPRAIGNLHQSLEVFSMFNCNISCGIPKEINSLTNLTAIYLGGNKSNESILITLGKLKNIQLLSFQDNQLEGSIPNILCCLTALFQLELGGNKLSRSIPTCFGNLTTLRNLYMVHQKGAKKKKKKLYLGFNELTSTPSTLWNLKDILDLVFKCFYWPTSFRDWKFKGVILTTIGDLQYLFLEYNRWQGSILDSIGDLISLKSLDLSNNNFSRAISIS
ncbi:hypothetical protein CUMW_244050 [Citrus unshiu]|uniref:Leucine-rich repeat-containing N-terminal plant-type domain-containing protein n=1 Tax=Citrus unshiu TaxID=55188 RepID=A0A2H5QMH2_CITUN|nr:hypothetical protein CUMW_244050 [Citrus unshiu]